MEHRVVLQDILHEWTELRGISVDEKKAGDLLDYAEEIFLRSRKMNLTGFKTREDILKGLILDSIDPLLNINVPRGTLFADIGTGAGIPGVPLGIYFDNFRGVLIDSNEKKMDFVRSVIEILRLENLTVLTGRVEDMAHESSMRNRFDFVFSRAVGGTYLVIELAAALLVNGGYLYIYSHEVADSLASGVLAHADTLGLDLAGNDERGSVGIVEDSGYLFVKKRETGLKYPRRFAVIKREGERCI